MKASSATAPDARIEAKVAFLRDPATHPDTREVETIETHMSWVFLTGHEAYKLKKPVRYDFLDFTTLAARERNAREEVRLNRRLSDGVYLGVRRLTQASHGRLAIDGRGDTVDWLVHMRRLPRDRMLDVLIRDGHLVPGDVQPVAEKLAAFYVQAAPIETEPDAYRGRLRAGLHGHRAALLNPEYGLEPDLVRAGLDEAERLLDREPALFENRAVRIVEGHGDLRPEHVCLESPPVVFDCLEFNREFRLVDPADELAALGMECERLGAAFVGDELLFAYQQRTGDGPPPELIDFYRTGRAALRAKLAIWHLRELEESAWGHWRALTRSYLRLASRYGTRLAAMG